MKSMQENKKYFDYLNNEIKDGMIIQHVVIKPFITQISVGDDPEDIINLPENIWNVISEYKVFHDEKYNTLFADLIDSEITISQSLESLLFKIDFERCCIAIKGISDKKDIQI